MAKLTVFGAGAMGTAVAMHLARAGNETTLWASSFDEKVLPTLQQERRHPALPDHLPDSLVLRGPGELTEAAERIDIAVMGAHSGGARTLGQIVAEGTESRPTAVILAKGLEPVTGKRMSEVYTEELGHDRMVSMGGPALAPEVAAELPTAAVLASVPRDLADEVVTSFRTPRFRVEVTDDVIGVEYCTVAKNVAAIGMGIIDGLGKVRGQEYRNAKAALFTQAFHEITALVEAIGGRPDTVHGLAGLGDTLVTSLGGRNRLFGEIVGEGTDPETALERLAAEGMTVEGWESAQDIGQIARKTAGLRDLPYLDQVHRILFEAAPASSLLDSLDDRISKG
jgi:glycerol-3-phosphate dehydrogenase (NAD(P)+)